MADVGFDTAPLLKAATLDPAILHDRNIRVPTEKMSLLWRAAAELSGDPSIGLIGAAAPLPGNFDILGYAMLSSPNLRAAMHSISRYMRLVSDAAELTLEPAEEFVNVRFNLFGGRETIPRQRIEFDLLTILNFFRWVAGRPAEPVSVQIVYPPSRDLARYAESFRCPVKFNAEFNGWVYTATALDARMPAFNPIVAQLHENLLQQEVAAFDGTGLSMSVRREITRQLPSCEPRRDSVAHALNVSDRSLRRRLREEGTSFEKLLDSTRCDLAQNYLTRPNLSTAEVAYLLGFADPGTFFRACRRWFDTSPTQLRASLLERQRPGAE
ncbi:AraC family transcriptional regulator [Rhodoblastus sp.]|uniref:AraC family transcriptional regulator n=1 Tax=Rhodoblastus sp. TaxID=1962975 RepID=UPI0035B37BC1